MQNMRQLLLGAVLLAVAGGDAMAAQVSRSYSYFTVRGKTLEQLERQLETRGPKVKSTGQRHPGATQMTFTLDISYSEDGRICRVEEAQVSLSARVILPRWARSRGASRETALIWDTLAADIRRHEESHIIIAKNHARELENAVRRVKSRRGCEHAASEVLKIRQRILNAHDRAQSRFDKVEGINFERRMERLLRYNIQRGSGG